MFRDKDYLRTREGLLFNVIGYDHAPDRATANLKYVRDRKWTAGYAEAVTFLREEFPSYIDTWITVPRSHVTAVYHPQEGLRRLLAQSDRNPLEQTAVDLATQCSTFFDVPLDDFGITDSLLWGRGRDGSDVDLVVVGSRSASIVLDQLPQLFAQSGFERLGVRNFTRQHATNTVPSEDTCRRKTNKGLYRGVRFSLRAVRSASDISAPEVYRADGLAEIQARVIDHSESLFFPAIYRMDSGVDVVSFAMSYEAMFHAGDVLAICGTWERGTRDRIVVGGLSGERQSIRVVEPSRT